MGSGRRRQYAKHAPGAARNRVENGTRGTCVRGHGSAAALTGTAIRNAA